MPSHGSRHWLWKQWDGPIVLESTQDQRNTVLDIEAGIDRAKLVLERWPATYELGIEGKGDIKHM